MVRCHRTATPLRKVQAVPVGIASNWAFRNRARLPAPALGPIEKPHEIVGSVVSPVERGHVELARLHGLVLFRKHLHLEIDFDPDGVETALP